LKKQKPKTYSQRIHPTRANLVISVVAAVLLGACAVLAHRVGSYLVANIQSQTVPTHVTLVESDMNADKPAATEQTGTTDATGSDSGGSAKQTDTKANKTTTKPTTKQSSPATKSTTKKTTTKKKPAKKSSSASASKTDIASESSCPGQSQVSQTASVLVCMTTYARKYHKLGGVTGKTALMNSAAAKAQDIKDCGFSHTACGHAFNYWFSKKGYTGQCQGENIAQGQETPGEVFKAWMNSSTHRANILNTNFDDIGVASLSDSSGIIWVMQLGGC